MALKFKPATKEQAKLRLALFGPSGSGKTFTALRLAKGLGGEVAVIDTEHGSASKYADRFTFDVLEPPKTAVDTYVAAITAAGKNGYDVLIVDSLTHGWYDLLDEVNRIARARFGGNTWSAWSEGTPKQRSLVNAILAYPGHIIATMRTKTEWTVTTDEQGRTKPIRLGLAPEQGKGIEYEFDLLGELSPEHALTITKDRTGRFQDRTIELPGTELGEELAAWLSEGTPPTRRPWPQPEVTPPEPEAPNGGDGKRATIRTQQWAPALTGLIKETGYYRDGWHATGAAAKCGYYVITDDNLREVLDALRQYAADQAAMEKQPQLLQQKAHVG